MYSATSCAQPWDKLLQGPSCGLLYSENVNDLAPDGALGVLITPAHQGQERCTAPA